MALFDRRGCVMAQLAITGPESEEVTQPTIKPVEPSVTEAASKKGSAISVPGVIMTAVGGAGLIAGCVLLAIAGSNASELSSPKDGTAWGDTRQDKYDGVKPMRIGGGIALGVGAALAAVGVVFLVKGFSTEEKAGDQVGLSLTGQGVQWTGRF